MAWLHGIGLDYGSSFVEVLLEDSVEESGVEFIACGTGAIVEGA